jgi:phage tail sheath gpL-like
MPVSFNKIPNNIRVPLFYAEIDNSMANTGQQNHRALLIGQSLNTEDLNIPKLATSQAVVNNLTGEGSMLAQMYKAFRKNNAFMETYILPLGDNSSGTAASGTITITGTAVENGVLSLYIAGELVAVPVSIGDTAAVVATNIANQIGVNSELPVVATSNAGIVTLNCKWAGLTGNDVDIRLNYRGEVSGETTPTGITVVIAALAGGLLNPVIATALANLSDEPFDFIAMPYTDTANLDAVQTFMDDTTGRWSWAKQLYGHVWTIKQATVADAQTLGSGRNDQHTSIGVLYKSPTPSWNVLGAWLGSASVSLDIDPARPLQTLPLIGVLTPDIQDRFDLTERNTLLYNGISTFSIVNNVVQIERVVTSYQKNSYGEADNSYLDVCTLYTAYFVLNQMRQRITSKYGRHKLANDGTHFGSGQAIVTPNVIRAELIAYYRELEYQGLVENADLFKQNLIVERNLIDPNRVDVLFPPDYVNQLRVLAVLNQFRLQY